MRLLNDNDKQLKDGSINQTARNDFDNAMRKGFWSSVFNGFNPARGQLLPFDEIRKHLPNKGQYFAGLKTIELEKIVGSVGRYNDFDRKFMPIQRHTRSRWINIDRAMLNEEFLPPIEVYQIGPIYFVKDGNHRVSVAREKGQIYIDANVIRMPLDIHFQPNTNIDELIREIEKSDFNKETRLKELRPFAKIEITLPGGYAKLSEHIHVHRWFMGEHRKAAVPWDEAVIDWYDRVYLPLIRVITNKNILADFPGRTDADLYVWIIEHLWYLRNEEKYCDVTIQDAAERFTREYSYKPLRRLKNFARDVLNRIFPNKSGDK
jgi:hypothetical protein